LSDYRDGTNKRLYGAEPFTAVVVHGGPGAAGECAPLARELGRELGVIEHLQTALSLDGQVSELGECLGQAGSQVALIGHSYGALLSLITAAKCPSLVKKLILVGSAPLEDKYAGQIMQMRRNRLSAAANAELDELLAVLGGAQDLSAKNQAFAWLGRSLEIADAFDPLPEDGDVVTCRYDIYEDVWPEMSTIRTTGKLLACVGDVRCPVVAIHGDYDPHPASGVQEPLQRMLRDFKFIMLEKCGHTPWREKQAREAFYRVLRFELRVKLL